MPKQNDERYGVMALSQARKLKELMVKLENTTIGTLTLQIASLEDTISLLRDELTQLRLAYEAHTHTYVDRYIPDTADGSGVAIDEIKTTGGIN